MKNKCLIVLSGGLDSTVALYTCVSAAGAAGADNCLAVSFDYGSKHNAFEIEHAARSCEKLDVEHLRVELPFINELFESDLLKSGGDIPDGHYEDASMKRTVVPFRNGIMLSIACGIAESKGLELVVLGNHEGDHAVYPDCRTQFIKHMSAAMEEGTYKRIKILTPFGAVRKESIVETGHGLGVDWQDTYSCYKGGEVHCGKCGTCTERIEAFELAGIEDPTVYETDKPKGENEDV